jgi:hypothetical protein
MEYNMPKEIQLTQGQVALVDDWRYDELNQYKWYAAWDGTTGSFYARRAGRLFAKRTAIMMHAVVARTPRGMYTDHINHNTLDNRHDNLRICTNSQNQHNRGKHSDNTSGYKGVFRNGRGWMARIVTDRKITYLGTFKTEIEAARAYDEAAKRLHGKFAALNFSA